MNTMARMGILVGGGPAPGINSAISAAVIEAVNSGLSVVGILDVEDPGDTHIYSLSGADASYFDIVNGQLKLKSSVSANYEAKNSYAVTVTATDSGGLCRFRHGGLLALSRGCRWTAQIHGGALGAATLHGGADGSGG